MGFLIRAVESELYNQDKSYIVKKKEELTALERDESVEKELKRILHLEQANIFNKIVLIDSKDDEKHGFTTLFSKGATIRYSSRINHLVSHIIIAHELGHLLLHTTMNEDNIRELKEVSVRKDGEKLEIQATYFAEKILRKMEKNFDGTNRIINSDEKNAKIREAIISIQDYYNLSKIGIVDDL